MFVISESTEMNEMCGSLANVFSACTGTVTAIIGSFRTSA